ncbi:hypothetical protein ABZ354_16780 [Streptomyces sp. NPDC005925]|uniref:hypothetical protein n=1 Tax=Streptomyces sp. NPDC005925 TaxID=3157172 RepID=UPI0033CB9A04
MLRITDARSGELVDAARPRRVLTRVEAHTSGFDPTNLRVLLVADTLVRALELGGTPVWALLSGERDRAELCAAAAALGIRPFEHGTDADARGLGETRVIHVVAEGSRMAEKPGAARAGRATEGEGGPGADGDPAVVTGVAVAGSSTAGAGPNSDGIRIAVAPVEQAASGAEGTLDAEAAPGVGAACGVEVASSVRARARADAVAASGGGAVSGAAEAADPTAKEPDPAALRLALLMHPRSAPCRLDPAALRDARDTLARWRRAVADWARLPSRPVPDDVRARVRAAWEDDLDVPGMLHVLRDVEGDPELPDGARFETYVHADRILGVGLARDLGGPA